MDSNLLIIVLFSPTGFLPSVLQNHTFTMYKCMVTFNQVDTFKSPNAYSPNISITSRVVFSSQWFDFSITCHKGLFVLHEPENLLYVTFMLSPFKKGTYRNGWAILLHSVSTILGNLFKENCGACSLKRLSFS